ncbi:hypothetical protein PRIC2_014637 [Phytophthora ramorum]
MHRCLLITLTISSVFLSLDASAAAQHSEPSLAIVSSSHRLVVPDKIDIVPAVRFLRAGHTAPDEGEERAGLSVSMAEKAKTLLSSSTISTEKLQKWLSSGKNADTVFSRMKLTKAGDDLLSNPQFSVWIKYVDDLSAKYPAKATSAITTLTTQYGDDALYKLLESAKKLPRTENLATRLQTEQMQHWATVGKSPDDVFRLFGLRRAGNSILTNPKFISWTTYVDDVNALNPTKAKPMISTLRNYYDDDILFKMLDAAKKSDETKSIATKLEAQQLQGWLKSGNTPDSAFVHMGLGDVGDNVLASPLFSTWVKYLDDFNAQYSAKETTVLHVLTKRFKDERLAKIIAFGKTLDSTKAAATKLETQQLQGWLRSGKAPDSAFVQLGLGEVGVRMMTSPLFSTWVKYLDDFNAQYPAEKTTLFRVLARGYEDEALIKIIAFGKTSASAKISATKLETQQLQGWLRSGKTPDSAFVQLGLGKVGDSLLASPLFSTWVKYLDDFNAQYSAKETTLFHVLTKRVKDKLLAKIIAFGKTLDSTKAVATKLEDQQRQVWLTSGKSSDDVFTLLKLDKAPDNFFDNPLYKTWGSYMNVYNNKHPGKQTNLFKTLTTKCKDKPLIKILEEAKKFPNLESTASKLQTEKIQRYLASKKSPDEVFTLLGLGDAWDNVIGNPLFKTWLTYVKTFDQGNPAKTDWYVSLHAAYGDGGVESMVHKGLQNPSTVKIAEKVQAGQLERWLVKEKSPDLTFNWILRHPTADEKVFADPRFETWAKYLGDFNQRYPDKKTTMIDAFRASYNDRALLRMFDATKKVPGSEKLVTNLENALLDKWVSAKETPAVLSRRFSGVVAADEMIQRYIKKADAAGNIA